MLASLLQFFSFVLLALPASAARYPSYGTLQTTNSSGVLNVVINNTFSTINLFDFHVMADLANLIETLQRNDTDIKVVVFSSGNKDFFFAHLDLNLFAPGSAAGSPLPEFDPGIPSMIFPDAVVWNITQLPQATIAVIEGRARGIGNEFLMACDMRFASTSPSVLLSQVENAFGVTPGAGGALYLSHLIGRGRTFEYVLSASDVDAVTAERVGWINRAFTTSAELHKYVQALAARIALFPLAGIAGTKQGVNAVSRPPQDVFVRDSQDVLLRLMTTPVSEALIAKWVNKTNNQNIGSLELNFAKELLGLYEN